MVVMMKTECVGRGQGRYQGNKTSPSIPSPPPSRSPFVGDDRDDLLLNCRVVSYAATGDGLKKTVKYEIAVRLAVAGLGG